MTVERGTKKEEGERMALRCLNEQVGRWIYRNRQKHQIPDMIAHQQLELGVPDSLSLIM